jgi:transposase-like protein
LNNVIEQHDRNVKSRANVMLGFKRFSNAEVVLAGVELAHRIRKGQIDFAELGFKENHCARRLGCRPFRTIK